MHPVATEDFCLKCVLGEKRVDADLFEVLEEWWATKKPKVRRIERPQIVLEDD
jgi:hypothetical protein